LQWLVQRGHGGVNLLVILSDLNRPQTVEPTCEYALKHFPDDVRPQFSLASLDAYHSKWEDAVTKLKPVIKQHPEFLPAQALYVRAIVQRGDQAALAKWSAAVPNGIEAEPQYWLAAGIWSQQENAIEGAAASFWRAARLNENDGEALSRLSAALTELGRGEAAKAAARRAAKLAALRDDVDSLISWKNNSQTAAVKIANTLEELGRRWEATTWLQAAFRMTQNKDPQLSETYQSIRDRLTSQTPWQLPEDLVAAKLDLSDLPSVDWQPGESTTAANEAVVVTSGKIRFHDQAGERGLEHVCKLGKPPGQEASLAIYQSGAGGAGVIDFDLDGWPDLYLTNMDGTPKREDSSANQLHRNLAGSFADVTDRADVGDRGFAQGVAVGDYNSDGFADLLVANVGRDHLYRNNGDGTFSDVTGSAGLSGQTWTTSVAIADIDGDSYADLFQVGYCGGDKPLQQKCIDKELNQPRSCAPLAFDPQADRVWRGLGDGTFAEVTDDWLGEHAAGRGFGLIIGNLDQQAGLDVYVANDMTANHYWSPDRDAADFRLIEQATIRGLAFNERSLSQASMGIAAADADDDGDLDFLLTHFSGDYNTFYEQVGPGMWADRSQRVGLAAPSQRMLGYGTQFLDADNDGTPELFVANGDIDDFSHQDRFFRQPVQLFDRAANGRWTELARATVGDYFSKNRLARAVATLDADRDGRTDLAVTHLFDPVALLINRTDTPAKQTRLFLRGTRTNRDAIGAQVRIDAADHRLTQQLLAGDGFQCSNERCLSFGTGEATKVNGIQVTWPDGSTDELPELKTGADYLVIQGSAQPFALAAPPAAKR
jgi:tetratricopeptide (TPR) repeat protein